VIGTNQYLTAANAQDPAILNSDYILAQTGVDIMGSMSDGTVLSTIPTN
jgi:hypothetical protein